ncbi:peptidoglycan-binding domain-containing protein [Actinokineospora fastidiosa]|uniref:Peptidoglycan binding-like domain-containing protein n=1 Tax=Actinokineospora fastidiosa TaxID=1816 RepID=A0A918GGE5_9PSEU|nr:peptidoglycan-binding domain-containing protein [Actinokineospora fastidiosa]GGS34200.1 hypothetical protein GCM10010171_30740 [Actinokineospora fastidiosa]
MLAGRVKRIGTVAAVVAAAAAGVVVSAGPAAAATPLCSKVVTVTGVGAKVIVPASSGGSLNCLIGRGLVANETIVRQLQHTLVRCYTNMRMPSPYTGERVGDIAVDGDFGPRTEAAVKAVQAGAGVTVDGIYGSETRNRMRFRVAGDNSCARLA